MLLSEGHHKKYAIQLTLVYYIFQIIGYIFLENSVQSTHILELKGAADTFLNSFPPKFWAYHTLYSFWLLKKYAPDWELHVDCVEMRKRGATFLIHEGCTIRPFRSSYMKIIDLRDVTLHQLVNLLSFWECNVSLKDLNLQPHCCENPKSHKP